MNKTLLPPNASALERNAAAVMASAMDLTIPIRLLWNADTCPAALLPYLAWSVSVTQWNEAWTEQQKRAVIKASWNVHKLKGTVGALRRAIQPFGRMIKVTQWWEDDAAPGTFKVEIGVLDTGITDEQYAEMTRVINDTKPCSRHLTQLTLTEETSANMYAGAAVSLGGTIIIGA